MGSEKGLKVEEKIVRTQTIVGLKGNPSLDQLDDFRKIFPPEEHPLKRFLKDLWKFVWWWIIAPAVPFINRRSREA